MLLGRDGKPSLKFKGELIASVESSADRAHPDYSGTTGRWSELDLYRTETGQYVAARVDNTLWQGDHNLYSAEVCSSESEVIEFFGQGRLAQTLYAEAEIDNVEVDPVTSAPPVDIGNSSPRRMKLRVQVQGAAARAVRVGTIYGWERRGLKRRSFLAVRQVSNQASRLSHEGDVTLHAGQPYARFLSRGPGPVPEELSWSSGEARQETWEPDPAELARVDEEYVRRQILQRLESIDAELLELGYRFPFWED